LKVSCIVGWDVNFFKLIIVDRVEKIYKDLLSKIRTYGIDDKLVSKAFEFAYDYHKGQFRFSGDPYIIHPLEVALILTDYYMDEVTIASALLHDLVEDTPVSIEKIYQEFGKEVGFIVESLTKLQKISPFIDLGLSSTKKELTLLNLKRLFVSTSKDIRVIIIKLADRLHNLRTIDCLPEEKKKRIALETLDFYVPIVQKLGIWKIKSEMEDIAFRIVDKENYDRIKSYIEDIKSKIEGDYQKIINILRKKLEEKNINSTIQSRIKTVYSIYNKMVNRGVPLDEIMDIGAIRVIVDDVTLCYLVLGIIHNLWMPIPDRIKDYIAKPKPNGYQSLHTVVYNGYPIEFQIRTWNMHYTSEYGVASHWRYKGVYSLGELDKILASWKKELEGINDLKLENIRQEVFSESVFVFTPKGDCLDLPKGATPIDFAYKIHTEVGNKCSGCKVNGKIVPLNYELKNGDIVEIITSKNSSPTLEWLKIVKTDYARSRIKQFLKNKNKKHYIQKAINIFSSILRNYRSKGILIKDDINVFIKKVFDRYYSGAYKEVEDFLLGLGANDVKVESIESKIKQIIFEEIDSNTDKRGLVSSGVLESSKSVNLGGILYRFAKCCNPIFPQPIVGYITRGNGISIHSANCKNLKSFDKHLVKQLINLSWDDIRNTKKFYLTIFATDKKGLLQEILNHISSKTVNITSVSANVENSLAKIDLALELPNNFDIEKLKNSLLKKVPNIVDIKG
jgi:GTP pyrophosphokinase